MLAYKSTKYINMLTSLIHRHIACIYCTHMNICTVVLIVTYYIFLLIMLAAIQNWACAGGWGHQWPTAAAPQEKMLFRGGPRQGYPHGTKDKERKWGGRRERNERRGQVIVSLSVCVMGGSGRRQTRDQKPQRYKICQEQLVILQHCKFLIMGCF